MPESIWRLNAEYAKNATAWHVKVRSPVWARRAMGTALQTVSVFLSSVKIRMDTIYKDQGQETGIKLFGKHFDYPVFAAPIGGMSFNFNNFLSEEEYCNAVVLGTVSAGCAAFTADGPDEYILQASLPAIKASGGIAIPTIKPWENKKAIEKIKIVEEAGAVAVAMDIDSAGLVNLIRAGKPVYPKSTEELAEIVSSTKLPLILKGVMTAAGAQKAQKAGAYGIVVSSHGGRVLSDTPPTCASLPEIRAAVGHDIKIFVDGGIRSGSDVFKALALGADAVLIGRPYAVAAFGGNIEGVSPLYKQNRRGTKRDHDHDRLQESGRYNKG